MQAKLLAFFKKFKNTVCNLMVNETKITTENALIVFFLYKGVKKESKYDEKKTFFRLFTYSWHVFKHLAFKGDICIFF